MKYFMFCVLFAMLSLLSTATCWAQWQDEVEQPNRMMVQDELDYCLHIIYEIHTKETTQEEGLDRLESVIHMMKFRLWFSIKD